MTSAQSGTQTPTNPIEAARAFPKNVRLLRSSEFRKVYAGGLRITGPFFAAFCRRREEPGSPRIGFTVPRALGKAVVRNRLKRRVREAVRLQLPHLEPQWDIVINPRRGALEAPFENILREVERLFSRCKA